MSSKKILLKVKSPLKLEYYKKKINDIEVEVRRELAWSRTHHPINCSFAWVWERLFSTKELGIDVNILDVSEDISVQYTILTDIDDDLRDMIDEEYGSSDIFNEEWQLYKNDYQIDFYTAQDWD